MKKPVRRRVTEATARRLAQAMWGELGGAWSVRSSGFVAVGKKRTKSSRFIRFLGKGRTWREACVAAGLLPVTALNPSGSLGDVIETSVKGQF